MVATADLAQTSFRHSAFSYLAGDKPMLGKVVFVDSAHTRASNGNLGISPDAPLASIAGAFDNAKVVANSHNQIIVAPGHLEAVAAAGGLDLDIAGVTIIFAGDGNSRGRVRFGTAVGADMDVDAADITMINPRFVANIDALTGPIDVNSARFKILNGTWEDGTTINTTDCIVADANADNMVIDGWTFIDGDAAGTQKQSHIQVAAATGVVLKHIRVTGDFGTGVIENGTAWVDAYLEDCVLDNASTTPTVCVLLQATSTGWVKYCHFRVASGTTYVTANNDMQFAESFGYSTDASAGEKVGTILAGDLEAKIDVIDEFHDVPAADNTLNAQMNEVIGNKSDAAAAGAVTATDTLVGYVKQLVTMLGTAADTDPISAALYGSAGIATFPASAAPANAVSMAEVMRDTWDVLRNGTGGGEPTTNRSIMDYLGVTPAFFVPGLGFAVTKSHNIATDNVDLFTVTGKVAIMMLAGEVTTVVATTTTYAMRVKTSNEAIFAATTITSDADDTMYLFSGDPTVVLNNAGTPTTRVAFLDGAGPLTPLVVGLASGSLTIESDLDQVGTGVIAWTLFYLPLEASASVVAA